MLCCELTFTLLYILCQLCSGLEETTSNKYEPNWSSLESRPLPKWFDNAKIGVFIHWGVFSVPSVTYEWFWFDWKGDPSHNKRLHEDILKFMESNYQQDFSYQDFAQQFTAEFFNASEWADIIGESGAKYVVLTSKHHDGFALWPSKYSYSWKSVDTGPHINIVGELSKAVRSSKYKIKFGLYHSLYEWFNPVYIADRSNNFTTQEFVSNKIYPEMIELVENYKPEIFWSDGEAEAPSSYWRSEKFISWLYNESPVRDSVVVNDRWGSGTICKHGGYFTCADRYVPGKLQQRKWENAMTIDKNTWGYNRRSNLEDYLSTKELIDTLVETVAYGGNLLVNIGPTKDGKITPIFQERLLNMGKWLKWNGEAIYGSKPWKVCQNDTNEPSIWYTKSNAGDFYATLLRWPKNSVIVLACPKVSKDSKITMIGYSNKPLDWIVNDSHMLKISLPPKSAVDVQWAWTLKIHKTIS